MKTRNKVVLGGCVGAVVVLAVLVSAAVYVVVSGSMEPTLEIGDLIFTAHVPYQDLKVGDVIVYHADGLNIVHRIVAITPAGIITQGDNRETNPLPDEPSRWPALNASQVRGLVLLEVPYLGLVSMKVHYPYNYLLVLFIFIVMSVVSSRPNKSGRPPPQVQVETDKGKHEQSHD